MKMLGIVRKIDALGRIVLPMEVRRIMNWEPGTPIEMLATEDGLYVRQYGERHEELVDVLAEIQKLHENDMQLNSKIVSLIEKYS